MFSIKLQEDQAPHKLPPVIFSIKLQEDQASHKLPPVMFSIKLQEDQTSTNNVFYKITGRSNFHQ